MKFRKLAAAAAALSLSAAPAMAQATVARTNAPATDQSEMAGGGQAAILVLFALVALVIGIAAGGKDDTPVSP